MKLAATLILYHPGADVLSNINSYYNHVDKIFVFDNTETETYIKQSLQALSKVEYYQDFKNGGIANRLNEGAEIAIQQGFEWMLTMDQDSCFTHNAIHFYIDCFNKYSVKEKVAMFGIEFGGLQKSSTEKCLTSKEHQLITSGALVNLATFKTIGKFDENLFIDLVDHDYSIRAKICGFQLIRFTNIYLSHQIGKEVNRSSLKTLFIFKKKKNIHSPLRIYYIYRNLLYLQKKYKGNERAFVKCVQVTAKNNIANSFFYGREAIKIVQYLIQARRDYGKNKMGKIE